MLYIDALRPQPGMPSSTEQGGIRPTLLQKNQGVCNPKA